MRKLHLLVATVCCYPSMSIAQSISYEQELQKEIKPFTNQMSVFMDWFTSPSVQNFLLLVTIASCCYALLLFVVQILMVYELLPKNTFQTIKEWFLPQQQVKETTIPATIVGRIHNTSNVPLKENVAIQVLKKEVKGMVQLQLALPKQDFETLLKNSGENQRINIVITDY